MAKVTFMELGFPIVLVDPPMKDVCGERVPDVNMRDLQAAVFQLLIIKSARLTGAEVRFVRKYLRLRQVDLAGVLNMANHSVVSQWESREDDPAGMDYNTEVLLRGWMAVRAGQKERLADLLEHQLKALKPRAESPLEVRVSEAA